ncbi:hypothetical protein PGT21_029724 [Puccinia graminis f. sp. tritici]|uniref:Extracellular mutant protein 11 C-terminal domain-containing protein n=1 Tax=Puccinia graminis f. sp. tritici TaxID=56615 RepID=A0A5B0QYJ6_PUCGR|nr:hypothetical protein PGT21_029724 [Puccinia graminis f. sp. tritici]
MLPPPLRKSVIPPSPKPSATRKPSISRQSIPADFSASPTTRSRLYNPQASFGSPSGPGRQASGRSAVRRGTEEGFPPDIFDGKQTFARRHLIMDCSRIRRSRRDRERGLFSGTLSEKVKDGSKKIMAKRQKRYGLRHLQTTGRRLTSYPFKESSHHHAEEDAPASRRFSVLSPGRLSPKSSKKRGDPPSFGRNWPMAEKVYKEPKLVESKGSPVFGHGEEPSLGYNWFEGQRIDRLTTSNDIQEGSSEGIRSSPFYEQIEDTERTILGPSSSPEVEKDKGMIAGLTDLDESLKLMPDPGEYRPGAYNSLTDEQWHAAGQKLIEKFGENAQRIQRIISARAERMVGYTTMISEYHNLLRQRRAELKDERNSIQEGVRGSIAGYRKPHKI